MSGVTRPYDPRKPDLRAFHDSIPAFLDGTDTPRDYLERCLAVIEEREPDVKAFVTTDIEGAREAADRSSERYRRNRPLSAVDGMPVCIKDLYETVDMPTQMNSPVYAGWRSIRDAAHVYALRKGGAGIVGKTVTTEFGQATPGPTRNPFDLARTPGGSSSGTAAAVGAGMVPAGSGSQVRGSIQRPAGYCGNYALKPTFGALNRGGGHSMAPSQSVLGVHAGSLEDCWRTAFHIAHTVGGDPGQPGLFGRPELEQAVKPRRLARLETRAWPDTEDETREIFEKFLSDVAARASKSSRARRTNASTRWRKPCSPFPISCSTSSPTRCAGRPGDTATWRAIFSARRSSNALSGAKSFPRRTTGTAWRCAKSCVGRSRRSPANSTAT